MPIKDQLTTDLKAAMIAKDAQRLTVIRALKTAITYAEVAAKAPEAGLSDDEITTIFARESKKRQESATLYVQGGAQDKADAELAEKAIIDKYLPAQLSEVDLIKLIDEAIAATGATGLANMGQVIGAVKAKAGASADGSLVARLTKDKLTGGQA